MSTNSVKLPLVHCKLPFLFVFIRALPVWTGGLPSACFVRSSPCEDCQYPATASVLSCGVVPSPCWDDDTGPLPVTASLEWTAGPDEQTQIG